MPDTETTAPLEPRQLVRFTRWRALGWTHEPPARRVLDVRVVDGEQEITFTGLTWGPAKHFELVDEEADRGLSAERLAELRHWISLDCVSAADAAELLAHVDAQAATIDDLTAERDADAVMMSRGEAWLDGYAQAERDRAAADTPKLQAAREWAAAKRANYSMERIANAERALAAAFTEEPAAPAMGVDAFQQIGGPCQLGLQGVCQYDVAVEVWDDTATCARCMAELRAMADENDAAAEEPAAPPEPERPTVEADINCTGGWLCPVDVHVHGCHADLGSCDAPGSHRAAPEATTPPTDGYFYGAMSLSEAPPEATTPERGATIDDVRRENAAWMNGVADLADEFLGTYDREAACGPADLLPALGDVAQLLRSTIDPVLVALREALAERDAASEAWEALAGFEDPDVLDQAQSRLLLAQEALMGALAAARAER